MNETTNYLVPVVVEETAHYPEFAGCPCSALLG